MMKHITGLMLLIMAGSLAVLLPGCAGMKTENRAGVEAAADADGVYKGSAMGFRGIIRVRLHMAEGAITEIVIVDSKEDRSVGAAAIEELVELVMLYNSTDIDAVSGATESSRGFLQAVENAILSQ